MIVYLDESGDTGSKIAQGSSRFFIVSMVIFHDETIASACTAAIDRLRIRLKWKDGDEFHFKRNSDRTRKMFLKTVANFDFHYYAVVIDKHSRQFIRTGLTDKDSLYEYACGHILSMIRENLDKTKIVMDKTGNKYFLSALKKFDIHMRRSESHNLLQLADYVAGAVHRSMPGLKHSDEYRAMIKKRENAVEVLLGSDGKV
jgi:hypothetical protein